MGLFPTRNPQLWVVETFDWSKEVANMEEIRKMDESSDKHANCGLLIRWTELESQMIS
jgi:hypothetical protein